MSRRLALALWLLIAALLPVTAARAQTPPATGGAVTITAKSASIDFPAGIDFSLAGTADFTITRIDLLCHAAARETGYLAIVPLDHPGRAFRLMYRLDLAANFLPAGIDLSCMWRFHGDDNRQADSPAYSVLWYDNRYDWRTIPKPDATIHYYGLSDTFAQSVAASVQGSIDSLRNLYGLTAVTPVQVWVYPNGSDFAGARQQNSREAVAGLSYPEFALTTAVLPEGNAHELGRVMPHEMSHQMLYQATRNPWNTPPVWLDEGLAELAQTAGRDGLQATVQQAAAAGGLLRLDSLNLSFPFAPQTAYLAYAQSYSAALFIKETWGEAGLTRLVRALSQGAAYDDAFRSALGRTVTQFEADWRIWIGERGRRTPSPDVPPGMAIWRGTLALDGKLARW